MKKNKKNKKNLKNGENCKKKPVGHHKIGGKYDFSG